MSQTIEKIRWTSRDLEGLPENEWVHYEIIDGELFMTRSPHRRHQQTCFKIARQLNDWCETNNLGEVIIMPGIIFSDADNVSPDVVWVSTERLAEIEDESGHLTGAPELVVEVISPGQQNQRRDREVKLKLYSIQGVREYWSANRFTRQVEIYRRENAQLRLTATLFAEDEITSPLLPGFSGAIATFF
ncbi:MAG: Uma2 family endonuclease [Spirulina sp.]